MAIAGQFLLQALHSVHLSTSIILNFPLLVDCGIPNGQTSAQTPHPVHNSWSMEILGKFIVIFIEAGFKTIITTS